LERKEKKKNINERGWREEEEEGNNC